MDPSDLKYAWPSTVNVANFVTVKPSVEGDKRSTFNNWKQQMACLLEGQDVVGFVDGEFAPPDQKDQYKLWRRTDRLVKGWILGSVGTDVLDAVRDKETARDVWLHLDNIFKQEEEEKEEKDSDNEGIEDYSRYLAVYQAAQRGDWDTANNFFKGDINELSSTIINSNLETALHVAVFTGKANLDFVNKLVEIMPRESVAIKNDYGQTALQYAAIVGNTAAAIALVNKNPDLLHIRNNGNRLPVLVAAVNCQKETLKYLICEHEVEHNPLFEGQLGVELLNAIISSEFVDIALDLAHKYPKLALLRDIRDGDSALSTIARRGILFPRMETFTWWQKFIYHLGKKLESMIWYVTENLVPRVKELREKKARSQKALQLAEYLCDQIVSKLPEKEASTIFHRSIMNAARYGISEIVEMIIHRAPEVGLYTDRDGTGRSVFMVAASNRYENVINLIYNMSDRRYMFFGSTDNEDNNLLHICGKLAPPHRLNLVAGAALQMQRELHWFKEMENFVHPSRRTWLNNENQTPQMIFTKEHEKLKADGERWMKDTANACTIAAALIATVVFAAAFTVPGGVEPATGIPLFSGKPAFNIFAVSDAISLFTSITSLLMFLSILTARYAEEDFLRVLPKRLSIGLISLFMSITFMMVAFSATLYILLQQDGHMAWFVVLIAAFACLPVASFVLLQFPLLVDVIYSTYGPGIFGKKSDHLIY